MSHMHNEASAPVADVPDRPGVVAAQMGEQRRG